MHFYGMGFDEVQRMRFSDFIRLFKSAEMILARHRLIEINVANFSNLKKDGQSAFLRNLKSMSNRYMDRPLKGIQEVAKNLALGILGRK